MDKKLKVIVAKGYTKKEAIANSGTSLDVKFDATQAWKKDGEPYGVDLDTFASEYVEQKVKDAVGVGFCITVEAGKADTKERPYKVTNVLSKGTRKFKLAYEGYINFSDTEEGTLVLTEPDKTAAIKLAKEYVTKHKTAVRVRAKKRIVKGEKDAAIVDYVPSLGTQLGSYIIFGYEN